VHEVRPPIPDPAACVTTELNMKLLTPKPTPSVPAAGRRGASIASSLTAATRLTRLSLQPMGPVRLSSHRNDTRITADRGHGV
jgi:hypothetical protein